MSSASECHVRMRARRIEIHQRNSCSFAPRLCVNLPCASSTGLERGRSGRHCQTACECMSGCVVHARVEDGALNVAVMSGEVWRSVAVDAQSCRPMCLRSVVRRHFGPTPQPPLDALRRLRGAWCARPSGVRDRVHGFKVPRAGVLWVYAWGSAPGRRWARSREGRKKRPEVRRGAPTKSVARLGFRVL